MTQISDDHLVSVLARAGREFSRARDALIGEDEPTPEQIQAQVTAPSRRDEDPEGPQGRPDEQDGERGGLVGALGAVTRFGARQVTGEVHPRHEDWAGADLDHRIDWWVDRLGTGVAALVALPSFGGLLVRSATAPVIGAVGAAGQVLVVNAVAHEVDRTDEAQRVVAAARIVLDRDLDVDRVRQQLEGEDEPEALTRELEEDLDEDEPPGVLRRLGSGALLVRRVARQFRSVGDLLDERPQGGLVARSVRHLPGVGAVGGFLAERGGVRDAAGQARRSFEVG
jgi:hypothetical protein